MKKEKYLQIFNYLLEFSKLRSKPVRNIESSETQYPEILWFADVPQYDIFDCITFPNYKQDADYWLKINKPKNEPQEPIFPKLSDTLTGWIEKESLKDENGFPFLNDSIIKDGKSIYLIDHSEVETEFQSYLNDKWIDDLENHKKENNDYNIKLEEYKKQYNTYKRLFNIYNKAQQFSEEYELIVGVGLLYFQENINTPLICRHILTSKAEIAFEYSERESSVKVSPSIENDIQIETDAIIDLYEQFDSVDIIEAEKKVVEFLKEKTITDNPFDNQIKEAIQIFADRIRPDGQVKDDPKKSNVIPQTPTVYFAPALLLRKRNTRSYTALFEKIIENISSSDNSIDIPSINDIISDENNLDEFSLDLENENLKPLDDETIYFPKKHNEEQIKIIEKARHNKKVLVQGPPGTGKSHTIANLICHLLANGKKVLVTAQTPRALSVLKEKLPDEFQDLTVNLLSGDSTSIQDLDRSVNAINDELSKITNLDIYKKEIDEKQKEFFFLKEQKAFTYNEWLKVKEKSTRQQNINRNYNGTLSEIAELIEKEHSSFAWFKDDSTDIKRIDLLPDIENFILISKYYQSIDCNDFNFIIPEKEKLLLQVELKDYWKITNNLIQKYSSEEPLISIYCKDYTELKKEMLELHKLVLEIDNNTLPFKLKLINDFRNNLILWKDKLSRTENILSELPDEKLKNIDRSIEIQYPNGISLIQLKNDAQTLLYYLNSGNALSGVLYNLKKSLLPKNIKEKLYFIDEVKVNGSPCDTISEFQTVLDDIKIKQDFEELEIIWEIKVVPNLKFYFDKSKFYKQLKGDTESFISLFEEANRIKEKIELLSSVRIQGYESTKILELIKVIDHNSLNEQFKEYKEKIVELQKYLSSKNIHPIATEIIKTLIVIDPDKYEQLLSAIDALNTEKEKYNEYKNRHICLNGYFPIMINEILENSFEFSNLSQLENAIYFKHAVAEITKLLAEDYETKLITQISELESREDKLISVIASKKAWLWVLESLNNNPLLRRHLQAWVLAVRKIGKTGTGKRALKFRREAQHQMEKCKDSIPCWIMPLYKVAETINPEQGMYDYVIIDEASQLGPDAIFLLYISKNIIIVGDDKQTSPEYVGVDANTMTPYIRRHLQNIPRANFFGTEFSFFDHAKLFCNGMIVLREHFRCMPEIIEFCNKNFYAPDGNGLYPLKQYSENRLKPLQEVYCQDGYVEGTSQNIINTSEAEAIANKIKELIADENYKGKSFGVIGLQGNRQAFLIENLIIRKIGEVEYKKRNIICGTSSSFQGDERDIMFLSLITATNHQNRRALMQPEDERRFNVAVSRAKEQVWLFHSIQLEDLSNKNDLRYKLLDHFINYKQQQIPTQKKHERTMGSQPEPFESWFEVDVYNDIVTNNYSVIPQYEVAKGRYRIDLVTILSNGVKIAIECDGDKYHSAEQFQNDLMRQKVLERCGWQFFRVSGAEYYSNRKKALEPLWQLLRNNEPQIAKPICSTQNLHNLKKENEIGYSGETPSNNNSHIKPTSVRELQLFDEETLNEGVSDNKTPQISTLIKISTDDSKSNEILVFTSLCNVYKVMRRELRNKIQALEKIDFEPDEKAIYLTGDENYLGYLIVAFENGKIGKISMLSYHTEHNRRKLKNAFNNESKLIFIEHIDNDIDLVILSSINKVVLFNTVQINPVESKNTKGVQVIKQKDGSKMIKVKRKEHTILNDPEYYRKSECLNIVGYYLKQGDEI